MDFKNTEEELVQSEEKIRDFEKMNKKLHYENQQLKKIIKLRNEIQTSRHKAITGLKSAIDEIMSWTPPIKFIVIVSFFFSLCFLMDNR